MFAPQPAMNRWVISERPCGTSNRDPLKHVRPRGDTGWDEGRFACLAKPISKLCAINKKPVQERLSRSSRGNEAPLLPERNVGQSEPPYVGCYFFKGPASIARSIQNYWW